jgi:TusA-related sulfurtransferase
MDTSPRQTLDLRGKECPFTILELGKTLRVLARGDLLEVVLGREAAIDEVRAWCEGTGNEFVASDAAGTVKVYVRKR